MSYRITDEFVCGGAIHDSSAALAQTLETLAEGGLDLEMIMSRRDQAGWSLIFVSPLRSQADSDIAEEVGLHREGNLRTLRIEGPNVRGIGARIVRTLADEDIPIRGYWALSLGEQCVTDIAFDDAEDQARAKRVLDAVLNG